MASRSSDPGYIKGYLGQWAKLPGANPSLTNDPNYWVGRISQTGGLGDDNTQYWQDKALGKGQDQGGQQGQSGPDPLTDMLSQLLSTQPVAPGQRLSSAPSDPMFGGAMNRTLSAY